MNLPNLFWSRQLRDTWNILRFLIHRAWGSLLLLSGFSVLVGMVEAGLLGVVAKIAFVLGAGKGQMAMSWHGVTLQGPVLWFLIGSVGLVAVRFILQVTNAWLIARLAARVQARFQKQIFRSYLRASWVVQSKEREGHLQELVRVHARRAGNALYVLSSGLAAFFVFIALLVGAFAIHALIALAFLVLAGVLFAGFRPLAVLQRRWAQQLETQGLNLASDISEAVRLAEEHQVFGTETQQERRILQQIRALQRASFRGQFLLGITPAVYQSAIFVLLITALMAVAVWPGLNLANLGAIVMIFIRAFFYGQKVQTSYVRLQDQLPYIETFQKTLAKYKATVPPPGNRSLDKIERVDLQGVWFRYHRRLWILKGIHATLHAGEAVGIVGASGIGKSTLLQLLLRLRAPTRGEILVNGIPIQEIRWQDWHRLVAYVPQEPKLIRGTIADNIRFFREISDEEILAAAQAVHIHDEIENTLGGYHAVIDHRGETVSGGQRQRICLARALAGHPQLLILDEPTSALDAQSEALILQTLHEIKRHMTLVIVAHRPALLEICDYVWRLEGGHLTVYSPSNVSEE